MRYLRHNSSRMNFDPVSWLITMRTDLWQELTACWPCSYMTYRCTTRDSDQDRLIINANEQLQMRDEMRNGMYLLIDGIKFPVITDDGITEETDTDSAQIDAGQFASDIYVIPMSVRGSIPTTYFEYVDYSQGAMLAVQDGHLGNHYWTDGGRFFWTYGRQNWCVKWETKIEPRIILRTPQLAGRIQNVLYEPLQHVRAVLWLSFYQRLPTFEVSR